VSTTDNNALVIMTEFERRLAACTTVGEAKILRDEAESLRYYCETIPSRPIGLTRSRRHHKSHHSRGAGGAPLAIAGSSPASGALLHNKLPAGPLRS
jgi:hypothetical protein